MAPKTPFEPSAEDLAVIARRNEALTELLERSDRELRIALQRTVIAALDRVACPSAYMDIASQAILGDLPAVRFCGDCGHSLAVDHACGEQAAEQSAEAPTHEPLQPVDGDLLPPIGSTVYIHLGRSNQWVAHTVAGYYVWGDLHGDDALQRVFVRVQDASGYENARLLKDVRRSPNADPEWVIQQARLRARRLAEHPASVRVGTLKARHHDGVVDDPELCLTPWFQRVIDELTDGEEVALFATIPNREG